jgi:3-deoxy-manno-octulosonate cytidylyltransferase (CMP-KDO synthetase)
MNVILTSDDCLTGTDRVAEVADTIEADYYINVQGDEPLFNPDDIMKVVDLIETGCHDIINGYCEITSDEQYRSLSIPKVVFRPDGRLLYMSRSCIPGNKTNTFNKAWRQVCIYAFPKKALKEYTSSSEKTTLEKKKISKS